MEKANGKEKIINVETVELDSSFYNENNFKSSYNSFYNRFVKRLIDFLVAFFSIIIFSPILIIISLVVVIDSGFPIFYRPQRGGYRGKSFRICKYRTMVKNADKIGGGTTALGDKRITRVGRILRKLKLDELAQLFNVLMGTMSFVGPRPELLKYTDEYKGIEKEILNVRPGITDYSSIEFINLDEIVGGENADEMYEKYVLKRKNFLRLKYVSEVSFKTDFIIFMRTIGGVFKKAFGGRKKGK